MSSRKLTRAVGWLQFDNVTVSPSSVTVGNITTLTYQPPALLTPGPAHTVNLTYGAKTFAYAFTVINATTIPPSAAALAGSVNTNNSGFRVRVHQTREAQSTASAQRAEQQLAGLLGANIADLSATNAAGTFDAELINFEQNGGGVGDIAGEVTFPGIPGITDDGTTVNASTIKLSINGTPISLPGGAVSKVGKVTTITYQPAFQLSANSPHTIKLEFDDSATTAIVRQFSFTTGKATPQGGVLNTVKGYWTFDKGNLEASAGQDLHYLDDSVTNLYEFGITGQGALAAIPNINGKPAKVIHIPFTGPDAQDPTAKKIALKMNHGIAPNGGRTKVNQWTLVMDLLWGDAFRIGFGAVFRTTNLGTPGDADMFWRASSFSYGKSCCSAYAGIDPAHTHPRNEWARVVFAVDFAVTPRVVGKYINGFKHTTTVINDGDALDSRFSLPPEIELFGDEDNERTECYVNAIQIREGRMSDEEIQALGGPDASGIPSAPAGGGSVPVPPPRFNNPVLSGGQVTITWTGTGTLLESADLINRATVPGNPTSLYVFSASSAARKFYRLQQ